MDYTPEQIAKLKLLKKKAHDSAIFLVVKFIAMLLFVSVTTLVLNYAFVKSDLFIIFGNFAGCMMTCLHMKYALDKGQAQIKEDLNKILRE